jgi:hypothetical protein
MSKPTHFTAAQWLGVVRAIDAVEHERQRQQAKWGEQNHPDGTGLDPDGDRELADLARNACNQAASEGRCTYRLILEEEVCEAFAESDPAKLRAELVQIAAVAVAWVEAIDRRGPSVP